MLNRRHVVLTLLSLGYAIMGTACASLGQNINTLKQPTVSLVGLALKDLNPLSPGVLVRLRVENPNDLNVNLSGADVALALNGQPVATGLSRSPVTLVSFGASEIEAEAKGNTLAMLPQILALQANEPVNYQLTGSLHVLNWLGPLGRIPFTFEGSVDKQNLLRGVGVPRSFLRN